MDWLPWRRQGAESTALYYVKLMRQQVARRGGGRLGSSTSWAGRPGGAASTCAAKPRVTGAHACRLTERACTIQTRCNSPCMHSTLVVESLVPKMQYSNPVTPGEHGQQQLPWCRCSFCCWHLFMAPHIVVVRLNSVVFQQTKQTEPSPPGKIESLFSANA